MKKSSNRNSWSPLILLLLAVIFGYLSIRAAHLSTVTFYKAYTLTKIDLHWVFWLTAGLTLAFLLALINSVFRGLHELDRLPKPLSALYQEAFRARGARFLSVLRLRLRGLGGQLAVVGFAVLLVLGFLSNTKIIREIETNSYLNEWVLELLGTASSDDKPVTTLQIPLFMGNQDGNQYLRNCLKIVHDLQEVGARAVLIDLRGVVSRNAGVDLNLVDQLGKSGIVVFGAPDSKIFLGKRYAQGIYTLRPFEAPSSSRDREMSAYSSALLCGIQPAGGPPENEHGVSDVALELLGKYRGYPLELNPQRQGSALVFGDYRIPVTNDGWMYSRDHWGEIAFWPRLYAIQGPTSDTLFYEGFRSGVTYQTGLANLREEFRDKIFIVGRANESGIESFTYTKAYAAALENIVQNSVTRKIEINPLWLTALCILMSALIAYRFRPLASILLIFLFGVCLLIADSLLYNWMNILLEIIYPLFSVLMTMLIFPALSFVHRIRISEVSTIPVI